MGIERRILDEVIERFREQGGTVLSAPPVHCPLNLGCKRVNQSSCRIEHCQQQTVFRAHVTETAQPPEITG